jgi:hypothetical protein
MLFGGGGAGAGPAATPFSAPGGVKQPSMGKNSVQQNLHSPHMNMKSTITKGDTLSRSMGQYGKAAGGISGASPLKMIRGGTGQMKRIRGGLGPGKMGTPGGAGDYSMKSGDTE